MSDREAKSTSIITTTILRGLRPPKLDYIKQILDEHSIDYEVSTGFYGYVISVPNRQVLFAFEILNRPIAESYIPHIIPACILDLNNNNPLFSQAQEAAKRTESIQGKSPLRQNPIGTNVNYGTTEVPQVVEMFDVLSENISAMGFDGLENMRVLYVRFKGTGITYRYFPLASQVTLDLHEEILNKMVGRPGASVGKMFNAMVKIPANHNEYRCQKFVGGNWEDVLPKGKGPIVPKTVPAEPIEEADDFGDF